MRFITPTFLWLSFLSLPIIVFYLLKVRRRRVEVSTLIFWEELLRDEATVASLNKLRKLLSLLLQLLFLALLVFALGRPIMTAGKLKPRRLILLLDRSASMFTKEGDKTRIELARKAAQELVNGMGIGDEAAIITMSDSVEVLLNFTDDLKRLKKTLESVEAREVEAKLAPALKLALALPTEDFRKEIHIISDGRFSDIETSHFEPLEGELRPPPKQTKIYFSKAGDSKKNVGIVSFSARRLFNSPRDYHCLVNVQSCCEEAVNCNLEIYHNDQLSDVIPLSIAPRSTVTENLSGVTNFGGRVEARLDWKDDFDLDNHAYAIIPPKRAISVLLVTEANPFLEAALISDETIELTSLKPNLLSAGSSLEGYDVVILDRWDMPGAPNRRLIYINAPTSRLPFRRVGALSNASFTEWSENHPIFNHVNLSNIYLNTAAKLEATASAETLASSFGSPLVLAGALKASSRVRFVYFAFSVGPDNTDLPLRVAFPIMVSNAVRFLSGQFTETYMRVFRVGDSYLPPFVDDVEGPPYTVITPSKERLSSPAGREILLKEHGFYTLQRGDDVGQVGVNLLSSAETDIAPRDELKIGELSFAAPESGYRRAEIWFYLVCFAILLSAAEWFLYHRRVTE